MEKKLEDIIERKNSKLLPEDDNRAYFANSIASKGTKEEISAHDS